MFVKATSGTIDQYPYTVGDLRRDNPNTSFPKNIPEATMAAYGMFPVTYEATPSYNPLTQRVLSSNEPALVNGVWTLTKTVEDLTDEQIASKNTKTALSHRTTRNKLLAESDWTQMNDSPLANEVKTAWATYRQELRDISDLDAWPNLGDDDWPTKPE